MFCPKCGAQIVDEAKFCPYCGNQIEAQAPPVNSPYPGAEQPGGAYAQPGAYGYQMSGAPESEVKNTNALGLVALIVGIFVPLVGFICGGIGLSKIKKLQTIANEAQQQQLNKNKKLCIAGIVVPIVITVISIILAIVIGIALAKEVVRYGESQFPNSSYSDEAQERVEDYFRQYGIDMDDYQ